MDLKTFILLYLLKNKIKHAYGMVLEYREYYPATNTSTLYTIIAAMKNKGLIEVIREEKAKSLPRKIYGLTEKGYEEALVISRTLIDITDRYLKKDN